MVRVAVARMKAATGHLRRGQHARRVASVFTIREDVPDTMHTAFSDRPLARSSCRTLLLRPRRRFGWKAPPGHGCQVAEVDRQRIWFHPGCQAFWPSTTVFPFDAGQYKKLFDPPDAGDRHLSPWRLNLFHRRHLKIIKKIRGRAIMWPTGGAYWSSSLARPSGPTGGAIKIVRAPFSGTASRSNPNKMPRLSGEAVGRHLKPVGRFDFGFNQTDPVACIEDVSIE